MEICQHCGQNIKRPREIGLYMGLVSALWKVYRWCEDKNVHEFSRKDIKHLFRNENDTARFGDWVWFGGLVYKHGKGKYGLNLERCNEFFIGNLAIPTLIIKNPISGQITKERYKSIHEVPSIMEYLNSEMEWVSRFR